MSGTPWAAVLDVEDGDLRVRFVRPVREVTLTPECARTFAAALLVTAEEAEATQRTQRAD